jgi:hypothetical protein
MHRTQTKATYFKTRHDLPQGREWLVTTENEHSYVVTVWVEEELGRLASCRCKAFSFGQPCRHIRFVAYADSFLTRAPLREIQRVAA